MKKISGVVGLCVLAAFSAQTILPVWAQPVDAPQTETADPSAQLISMDFDGAPLKNVLKILSQQSGLNFIASQDIESKKVTVFFENVAARDALDGIASANGLRYEERAGGRVFLVYTGGAEDIATETRVFQLKYTRLSSSPLDIGGGAVIKELKSSEDLSSSGSSGSSGGAAEGGGAADGGAGSSGGGAAGGASKADSSAAKGIDKLVKNLLSPKGKLAVDINTNTLVVTDTSAKLNEIARVLEILDVPAKQVMLEVYVMEVRKNILQDYGLDWGGTDGALGTFTAGSRTTGFPFTEQLFAGSNQDVAGSALSRSVTAGTLNLTNFKATLHFLTSQTDTKILARPRVLTMNNEAAIIKLVTNAAIANQTVTTSSAAGIGSSSTNEAERAEIGITLKMTPQINDDASVNLFIQPTVTTVAASSQFPDDFLDPTVRTIRTMARVANQQTLVIGGLIDTDHTNVNKKVPVLGDIPLFGYAFKYKDGGKTDRELLIFVTPFIVEGAGGSLREDMPTQKRQVAVKRLLDEFREDEIRLSLEPASRVSRTESKLFTNEREILANRAANLRTPDLEREMQKALAKT